MTTLLDCPICLDINTDPVTLMCGHTFCRHCTTKAFDAKEVNTTSTTKTEYMCPVCQHTYTKRPELVESISLRNLVNEAANVPPSQETTKISCTYCLDSLVPAVKSCLPCDASLCDKHLKVHSKLPEHILVETTTFLEKRKCPVHNQALVYHCNEDSEYLCASCRELGEHEGHQVDSLDEATRKKKLKLETILEKLSENRAKVQDGVWRLKEFKQNVPEKVDSILKENTALLQEVKIRLETLKNSVLNDITQQEEQISQTVSDRIQEMERNKEDLLRKIRHIEELCLSTDPVTVLQDPESGDMLSTEQEGGSKNTEDNMVPEVTDLLQQRIMERLQAGLSSVVKATSSEMDSMQS